jgi:hypothetical protein
MQLYVSEGAVGWGPRLRLWAQTEITLLTLVPAGGAEAEALTTDSSHSSQLGGLVASVLLIASLAYFCLSKLAAGYDSLTAEPRKPMMTPETILVQMPTVGSAEHAGAPGGDKIP